MKIKTLLSALFIVALSFCARAQPSTNQTCGTAFELPVASGNVQQEFMLLDASDFPSTAPDPQTTCSGSFNRTIGWYTFTATATKHWIRTEGPDMDGRQVEVFSGTCGALTSIACLASNSAYAPLTGLSVGTTYFFRSVGSFPCLGANGNCQTGLAVVSDPVNDDCPSAIELQVVGAAAQVRPATEMSSLGATQSQPACTGNAAASDDDVWYRFTATATAHHFPYIALHTNDPVIQWFSGGCGGLTSLVCDGPHATGLTVGQTYFIRIHSGTTVVGSTLRILGDVAESAPNDECSGALPLEVTMTGEEPKPVGISTWLGTSSAVPCDTRTSDVWLRFTAPTTTVTIIGSASQNVSLFSGSCGSLACVAEGSMGPGIKFTDLAVGDTYYLKVGSNYSYTDLSIRAFAAPANDECSNATPLDVLAPTDVAHFTYGSTCGATQSSLACGTLTAADVWYSFTATAERQALYVESSIPGSNVKFEVLSGSCGSLASVFCNDDGYIYGPSPVTGLVAGTTYYLRVFTGLPGDPSAFRIGITEGVVNDDCPGAVELATLTLADIPEQTQVFNINATDGTGTCGTSRDLWYRFTANNTEANFLAAFPDAITGVRIELLNGACDNLTQVACSGNISSGKAHQHYTGLIAGTEYHVRIAAVARPFVPMLVAPPVNDNITGALQAPSGTAFSQPMTVVDGYAASRSYDGFCNDGFDPQEDTWYRFTATAATHSVKAVQRNPLFAEEPLSNNLVIEVFDTLSTDGAVLDEHMIGCNFSTVALTGLTIGHEYWYRVYISWNSVGDRCAFSTWYTQGSNDEASGAVPLTYGNGYTHYFNTTAATQSQAAANCVVNDFADDDIWFSFAANGSPARVVVDQATADITLEVFSGAPASLTSIGCDGNVLVLPALTSGQTYYVRLYSSRNATPVQGRIGLFTTPSLTANPLVDEACLGPVLLQNPSIEQGTYCLAGFIYAEDIQGMGIPIAPGWPRLQASSSDAYSSCQAFDMREEMPSSYFSGTTVLARSGKGMAGSLLKAAGPWREYLHAPLSEPLIPGEPYLVSFHTRPGNAMNSLNGIGAFLSVGPAPQLGQGAIDAEPQVVTLDIVKGAEWTNISAVVVPDAPWDNITIGCFFADFEEYTFEGFADSETYYFFDDVVVARVTDPGCVTSIGDVAPVDEGMEGNGDGLRVYPNPANDRVNIVCDAGLFGERGVIEVFDVTGKRVHAEQVSRLQALQPLDLPAEWKEGLYLVMVCVEGRTPRSARVVIKR